MSEVKFDEVPKHYKRFICFDFQGNRLGWIMEETEWEAVTAWNAGRDNPGEATSAVGVD